MAELITVSCGNVSTTIDSMGAQMMSLKLGDAEYLWQGDERWWPRRSPVLFPIDISLSLSTIISGSFAWPISFSAS